MAQRPGGVDTSEIQAGFESLQRVSSARELEQLIDDLPVLSTPIFHSWLRGELCCQIAEHGAPLPGFIQIYNYLFTSLHYRVYRRLVEGESSSAARQSQPKAVSSFAPPYFLELIESVRDQLPSAEGPTLDPANDAPTIRAEIEALVGHGITLPDYQPSRGSHWSLLLVACASCRHVRLQVCAYGIDLEREPALIEALRNGRLNKFDCPLCSGVLCVPIRVWLQDGPGAGDDLASITCAWKVSDAAFIYQPPPGTPKNLQNNYILEVRFDQLLQRLGWDNRGHSEGEGSGERRVSFAIAYTADEVSGYVNRMTAAEPAVPFAMEVMILDLTRRLESGLLPLYDVEGHIRNTVEVETVDWPIVVPEDPLAQSSNPYNYLVLSLIAESLAEARKLPVAKRAFLAARTYVGYFSIGEVALAESALARAEDFLTTVKPDDPDSAAARLMVAAGRSQFFSFLGRHSEADHTQEQITDSPLLAGSTLMLRLARQELESRKVLSLKRQGRLAEALKLYPACVANLESMEAEASSEEHPAGILA